MTADEVEELGRFLTRADLTVADVAARIGPVIADHGELLPLDLDTALPGVREAHLWCFSDGGEPYLLELLPDPGGLPPIPDLVAALGGYQRLLTHGGRPPEVLFNVGGHGPWGVAVLARLEPPGEDMSQARVTRLAFRRDPPLMRDDGGA